MGRAIHGQSRAILIVEDEHLVRLDLMDFFEEHGFATFEAATAEEAIKILEARPEIQIVITDVDMPGSMDGMRLSHCIRDRWPPTVLIVTSGVAKPKASDLPTEAVFLSKPFNPRVALREIERLIS